MRFLADMGLARSTIAFLQARGHDAIHLRDEGLQRLEDDKIVEKALDEQAVLCHLSSLADASRLKSNNCVL